MKKAIMVVLVLGTSFLMGCLQEGENGQLELASDASGASSQKIYFDQAELDQIVPYKAECPGGNPNEKKICIQICHVPPGNPKASHDKILPIQAMKAHIGHGDYLGLCYPEDMEEPPVDEEPPTDGDTGSGGSEIPNWCLPFYDFDSNCDGFVDSSGEAYF